MKTSGFWYFWWLERVTWNEYATEKISWLKWQKMFINVEFKNEVINIDPLFPKHWIFFNVKVLTSRGQRPESSVQSLESSIQILSCRAQSPASRVQYPVSRVQRPESGIQCPASNSCVQRPGIPVCQSPSTHKQKIVSLESSYNLSIASGFF